MHIYIYECVIKRKKYSIGSSGGTLWMRDMYMWMDSADNRDVKELYLI
jgi:hypothetical protein